jgi:hypothetical protein
MLYYGQIMLPAVMLLPDSCAGLSDFKSDSQRNPAGLIAVLHMCAAAYGIVLEVRRLALERS